MKDGKRHKIIKNCYTQESIDSRVNKQKRTEYLRNWRQKNRDKVKEYKRKTYWKNPEKFRKQAREIWQKNKNSLEKGKTIEILVKNNPQLGLSATQLYRGRFLKDNGSKEIIKKLRNNEISIWKAYNIVRTELDRYTIEIVILLEKEVGIENTNTKKFSKIRKKFVNLRPIKYSDHDR